MALRNDTARWHSVYFGGTGSDNQIVQGAELFNPETLTIAELLPDGLSARSRHTANLLTNGELLIAGGLNSKGETVATADLWNTADGSISHVDAFSTPRRNHSATLMPDGDVLLWGGMDASGAPVNTGEVFSSSSGKFNSVASYPDGDFPQSSDAPILEASLPVHESVNVPIDAIIGLRTSKPLSAETVNTGTVTLSGPQGIEKIKVVAAENGSLVFVTPESNLLQGSTYTLTLNGMRDRSGLLLAVSGISFSTESLPEEVKPLTGGQQISQFSNSSSAGSGDELEWRGQFRDGKPHSNWEDLPSLQAAPGVTALAGQVLDLRGAPLAKVALEIGSHYGGNSTTVQTDETGRFLLANVEAGWGELIIDGREARRRRNDDSLDLGTKEDHGLFEYGLKIREGETNVLPFTIWLPKIETLNAKKIASPTTSEVVVTSPKIPGLELRIPAGTIIKDRKGEIVREVSLTKIPLDRTPFPLPDGVTPPVYFTAQPGGAYLHSAGNIGARIHYPNTADLLPGSRLEFWHYKPGYKGWYVYGVGTVPESGKQIIPDPGISVYEFTGAMAGNLGHRPAEGPPPCPHKDKSRCETADPVILANGLFVMSKTDLYLPDALMPISFTRTYRPRDTFSRAFGIGASHNYDLFVAGDLNPATFVDLIMPDGERVHYDRTSPGTALSGAVYENTTSPTRFFKSTLTYTGQFELKLKDGTVYTFKGQANTTRPGQTGLLSIRDRNGNTTIITRDSAGNVNRITSPNNRWIEFTYDASNRITQARDNIGRTVNYAYDVTGRLINVTDPNSGVTE
jgi:YD repeat-containing protein